MKFFFSLFVFITTTSTLYSQVIISGTISGLQKANVTKLYLYDVCTQQISDSTIVMSDSFLLKVNPLKPSLYVIVSNIKDVGTTVWVDSNDIQLSGNISDMILHKESESKLRVLRVCNNLIKIGSFNQTINDSFFHSIGKEMEEYYYLLYDKYPGTNRRVLLTEEISQRFNLKQKMFEQAKYFVSKYPNNEACSFIVYYLSDESVFTELQKAELHSILTEKSKNSCFFKLY